MGMPPLPPGHDKRTQRKNMLTALLVQQRVCKQDDPTASTRYQSQYRLKLLADMANEVSSSIGYKNNMQATTSNSGSLHYVRAAI